MGAADDGAGGADDASRVDDGVGGHGEALTIHAALTVLPIWVITYIFLPKVYRIYKLRNEKKEDK